MPLQLLVCDLRIPDAAQWRSDLVHQLFGPALAARVLAIPIPVFPTADVRVWDRALHAHLPLYASPVPSIRAAWIWKVCAHPRVLLFLWKVAWNRLPTRSLLSLRGLPIPAFCPLCGLEEETTEHALLRCSRSRLIWQLVGVTDWESSQGSWLPPFLEFIQRAPPATAGQIAYLAFHIWMARNSMVFSDSLTPVPSIIRCASVQAYEFLSPHRAYSPSPSLGSWVSPPAAGPARPRAIDISWEPPSPGWVKVNFDGSVRGDRGGAGFVIRDSQGQLLAAGGFPVPGASVPEAELTAAWAGILCAFHHLRAERVLIEGDSTTVLAWIRGRASDVTPLPILHDIWTLLRSHSSVSIRHVFREANTAADWVAAFVASHTASWTCFSSASLPPSLALILLFDTLGTSRTRLC